ncbi:hypothetical protein FRC17_001961, partial [Serendipita sp. 399]
RPPTAQKSQLLSLPQPINKSMEFFTTVLDTVFFSGFAPATAADENAEDSTVFDGPVDQENLASDNSGKCVIV